MADPNKPALLQEPYRPTLRDKWSKFSGDATKQFGKAWDSASKYADGAYNRAGTAFNRAADYTSSTADDAAKYAKSTAGDAVKYVKANPGKVASKGLRVAAPAMDTYSAVDDMNVDGMSTNDKIARGLEAVTNIGGSVAGGFGGGMVGGPWGAAGGAVGGSFTMNGIRNVMEGVTGNEYELPSEKADRLRTQGSKPTKTMLSGKNGDDNIPADVMQRFDDLRAGKVVQTTDASGKTTPRDVSGNFDKVAAQREALREKLGVRELQDGGAFVQPDGSISTPNAPAKAAKPATPAQLSTDELIKRGLRDASAFAGPSPQYNGAGNPADTRAAAIMTANGITGGAPEMQTPELRGVRPMNTSAGYVEAGQTGSGLKADSMDWRLGEMQMAAFEARNRMNSGFGYGKASRTYTAAIDAANKAAADLMDADVSLRNNQTSNRAAMAQARLAAEVDRYKNDSDVAKGIFDTEAGLFSKKYTDDLAYKLAIEKGLIDDATARYNNDTDNATSRYNADKASRDGLLGKVLDYDAKLRDDALRTENAGLKAQAGLKKDTLELSRKDRETQRESIARNDDLMKRMEAEFGDPVKAQTFVRDASVTLREQAREAEKMVKAGKLPPEAMDALFVPMLNEDGTTSYRQKELSELDTVTLQKLVDAASIRDLSEQAKGQSMADIITGAIAGGAGAYKYGGGGSLKARAGKVALGAVAGGVSAAGLRLTGVAGSDAEGAYTDDLAAYDGGQYDPKTNTIVWKDADDNVIRSLDARTAREGEARGMWGSILPQSDNGAAVRKYNWTK